MAEHKTLPRWGQYVAGGVLLAVAVTSGAVSLALNITHGLESSLATAITFGLADVAKISLPVVCVVIGWSWQTRITLVACALVSLLAATSYYLDTSGAALLQRQHAASVASDAGRAVTELEADKARVQMLADTECKSGRGAKCREYLGLATVASRALADARVVRAGIIPTETSGLAALVSIASGVDIAAAARWITGLKAALSILLLESLVYLSIPGAQMIARPRAAARKPRAKPVAKARPTLKLAAVK